MIIYIVVWEKILSLWHKNYTHGAELYIRLFYQLPTGVGGI